MNWRTVAGVTGVVLVVIAGAMVFTVLSGDNAGPNMTETPTERTEVPSNETLNTSSAGPSVEKLSTEYTIPDTERPGYLGANPNDFAPFKDVAAEVGLVYESEEHSVSVIDAHGPYIVDFNNNGYEDILLIGGRYPVLFENTGGAYVESQTFEIPDVSVAHFFDYNNNGHRDLLLIARNGTPALYENVNGTFIPADVGFDGNVGYSTTVNSADFTGNGCLDLFIGDWQTTERQLFIDELVQIAHEHPAVRPQARGEPTNRLFAGDCESFTDITDDAGIQEPGHTLASSAADFTGNGYIDLHVGVEWSRDLLYKNKGDGTFETTELGPDSDRNAMSSTAIDMTGNHLLDIFVTNVYFEEYEIDQFVPVVGVPLPHGNNLFVNNGDGGFRDVAPQHGVEKGSWGWASTVADYTNDGHLDIIHASSFADVGVAKKHSDIFAPPQVWKGTGESWEKIHGFDLGFPEHNIRGLARVDYQNNGVLDIVTVGNPSFQDVPGISPGSNQSFLYQNTHENNSSVQFWVRNPDGLEANAKVYVETDERVIYREVDDSADLLSQDSRLIHIGLGNEEIERVVVSWPDGTQQVYDGLLEGNRYILTPDDVKLVM